jgi:hypothetical protein
LRSQDYSIHFDESDFSSYNQTQPSTILRRNGMLRIILGILLLVSAFVWLVQPPPDMENPVASSIIAVLMGGALIYYGKRARKRKRQAQLQQGFATAAAPPANTVVAGGISSVQSERQPTEGAGLLSHEKIMIKKDSSLGKRMQLFRIGTGEEKQPEDCRPFRKRNC